MVLKKEKEENGAFIPYLVHFFSNVSVLRTEPGSPDQGDINIIKIIYKISLYEK